MMTFLLPFAGAFLGALVGNLLVGLMIVREQRKRFQLEQEFENELHDDLL